MTTRAKNAAEPAPEYRRPTTSTPAPRVAAYRHCPQCWLRYWGVGCVYSTKGRVQHIKCNNPTCGHCWKRIRPDDELNSSS